MISAEKNPFTQLGHIVEVVNMVNLLPLLQLISGYDRRQNSLRDRLELRRSPRHAVIESSAENLEHFEQ